MIEVVEHFEEEGAFASDEAVRSIKLHLTAVERFEQSDSADKVAKHINSFKLLLDHQLEIEQISEEAYQALKLEADSMIGQWG
ncbi:FIMAH domain-containing protein [Virgibacillus natechei]